VGGEQFKADKEGIFHGMSWDQADAVVAQLGHAVTCVDKGKGAQRPARKLTKAEESARRVRNEAHRKRQVALAVADKTAKGGADPAPTFAAAAVATPVATPVNPASSASGAPAVPAAPAPSGDTAKPGLLARAAAALTGGDKGGDSAPATPAGGAPS